MSAAEPSPLRPYLGNGRRVPVVVVAEDDADLRMLFVGALLEDGYRVVAARDGVELANTLDALGDGVDAVVADHRMPGIWGLDCLARYKGKAPFAIVTGHADSQLRAIAEHYGVTEIHQKPIDLETFKRVVATLVHGDR